MLQCNIFNINFENCISNASGPHCTTLDELININNSISGCVVSKTCTFYKRDGNPKPRYYDNDLGSINSMGLPNLSCEYYISASKKLYKPYIISVGSLNLDELLTNIRLIYSSNNSSIDGIEINLSCPNIVGKGQLAYDMGLLEDYLKNIFDTINKFKNNILIGIKLPPYFDIHQFGEVCDIICKFKIDFITCVNSIGNGLIIDAENETTFIKPKNGAGGIGGKYIKPTGLSNVRHFYLELQKRHSNIKIIGCGGIENGSDAFEYILCGAEMVQVGTQFYKEGVWCFNRISNELKEIMKKKHYKSLEDFRGKLKTIDLKN